MMENITCNAYLFFNGNCREAMNFYRNIFGGELQIQTFGEADNSCPEAMKDNVMHCRLYGGDILLMASDNPGSEPLGTGKVHLALGGSDEEKLREIFDGLSAGGKVGQPLEKQMWGDIYGDLRDKYDVQWMVNITAAKSHKSGIL